MSDVYECHGELNGLARSIADWRRLKKFQTDWSNVPEKLMLIVTELSEAMEAYRDLDDDLLKKLAIYSVEHVSGLLDSDGPESAALGNFQEELADTLIRLLDLTSSLGVNIEEQVKLKMEINNGRAEQHGRHR